MNIKLTDVYTEILFLHTDTFLYAVFLSRFNSHLLNLDHLNPGNHLNIKYDM